MDAADYVLSCFSPDEQDTIDTAIRTAVDAVFCWIGEGIEKFQSLV
jgi:peptidyl-tRNA hydrolase